MIDMPTQPLKIEDDRGLRVGDEVTVNETCKYHADYQGSFYITGVEWDYLLGTINVSIASEEEIRQRWGGTDGFAVSDLTFVSRGAAR